MKIAATSVVLASMFFFQIPAAQALHYKVLYSFQGGSDAANPAAELMLPRGGPRNVLLGTTVFGGSYAGGNGGTVYSINLMSEKEAVEASFGTGYGPRASLTFVPDFGFFGTTESSGETGYGTIFTLSNPESNVHLFGNVPDGADPYGTMLWWSGALYGTTAYGGSNGGGTVFSYNPSLLSESVVYSFCSLSNCTDGQSPEVGLIIYKDTLYGTTVYGGDLGGYGTVFSVNPTTGKHNVVHSFNFSFDGASPTGTLLNVNGALYGTTNVGGKYGTSSSGGTIFATDPTNGTTNVYWNFCSQMNCADGSVPTAGLIRDKATLYGTTYYGGNNAYGGTNGGGTVFSFDLNSGKEAVLYNFCSKKNCTDGADPYSSLLMVGAKLYGTTWAGGTGSCTNTVGYASGCGTVFEITR